MSDETSQRPLWPLALVAIAAIAAYLYASVEIEPDPIASRPSGSRPDVEQLADRDDVNILFVLIDTLRAERMSAYGYERDTTPFLKSLADTGVRFDHHIAQSSWTKSSMASMWASLNPIRVGVTKFNHTVASDIDMPAEILKDAGFQTVGLYRNGWVSPYFGFSQGFDKYYRPSGVAHPGTVQRLRPNVQSLGNDESLIADAIEFLRIHGHSSRWFLYLHMMDLHEYTYDEQSAKFGTQIGDLYDNSILRTDSVLERLYDYLGKIDLLKNTMIVVLSDHGEAFGERGFEGHARAVFPETTETPLIVSMPFAIEPGLVIERRTSNLDVWPTLFDLIGQATDREVDGLSRRDDILAAFDGSPGDAGAENDEFSVAFLDENWGQPGTKRKAAITVLNGPYRFVTGSEIDGRRFEALLSIEDGQKKNHATEKPEVTARLKKKARQFTKQEPVFNADTIELDEMQLNQLRALGYSLP